MPNTSSFNEMILQIVGETLASDDTEKILRDRIKKNIEDVVDDVFRFNSDARNAIKEKVTEVMVPAIEQFDFGAYEVKLADALSEIVEQTTLVDNKALLDNFKRLMADPQDKETTLEKLLRAYCDHVADNVDTSDLEVDLDDEPTYCAVTVHADIEIPERPSSFISGFERRTLYLYTEEDENLGFEVSLVRWERDREDGFTIKYQPMPYLTNLAHLSRFEVLLMAMSRAGTRITFDKYNLEDYVTPTAVPEADWS